MLALRARGGLHVATFPMFCKEAVITTCTYDAKVAGEKPYCCDKACPHIFI